VGVGEQHIVASVERHVQRRVVQPDVDTGVTEQRLE
jgi:hypothetical protein